MRPDRDLDRELRDLGTRIEYPPTPDLARSVRSRLEAEDGTSSPVRTRPQLWWIAAAALLVVLALPVFSLAMREMGGAFSAGRGAAGGVAESGEQEVAAGPTRAARGEGAASSRAADYGASAHSASAEAACGWPEPTLQARPPRGAPGDGFGVRGRYFEADVRDCDKDPARKVRVEFLQGGRTWQLGSVEVSKGSRLAARLEVPADASPGRATVRATYEQRTPEDPRGKTSVEARFFVTG